MSLPSPSTEPTLGRLLQDVARLMRRRFEQRVRAAQIPFSRKQCSVLTRIEHEEGLSQTALAHALNVEPIVLVRLVDRLEAAGLIERRLNPRDRRVWLLYLTPAAGPVLEEIHRLSQAVHEETLAGLPESRRQLLTAALRHLKTNLSARQPGETEPPSAAGIPAPLKEYVGKDA